MNLPIYSLDKIFENILSAEKKNHNVKVLYSTFVLLTQHIRNRNSKKKSDVFAVKFIGRHFVSCAKCT